MIAHAHLMPPFGLSPERIRLLALLPAGPPPAVVSSAEERAERRADWRKQYERAALEKIKSAEATIAIRDPKLMGLCIQVAVAHGVPCAAILSRAQHRAVTAARDEVWQRAKRELGMKGKEIAKHFGFDPSSVSSGLKRAGAVRKAQLTFRFGTEMSREGAKEAKAR